MGPGDGRSDRRDRGRDQVRGPRRGRDRQRVRDLSPDPLRTFHRERRERPALFGAPAGGGPARAVLAQTAAGLRSLSSPRGANPLGSLDRFVLTIFPLWMAAGAWVAKHRLERVAVAVGSILLIFYTVQFSSWSFIA